ncbi:unnamed protein product [Linum trigynum]|uniref:Gnk2-homologous domain-containing protein n=1 Tax=Linum trigynum TaxID=586398 RepID=A0AAV2EK04_9ROSI
MNTTTTTLMKAAFILAMAAALLASVSGQGDDNGFCSCGRADDLKNFRVSVRAVLEEVVKRTPGSSTGGDVVFTTTSNPGANLDVGAVVATGTCFEGGPTECSVCLGKIRASLKVCESSGCGGGLLTGDCRLQFRQIK